MGQEITSSQFSTDDFTTFSGILEEETRSLASLFKSDAFSNTEYIGGFEIETILVSHSGLPVPANQTFLANMDSPLVVHELAAFNIELNSTPISLQEFALSTMEAQLKSTWDKCRSIAQELSLEIMMVGILPSIKEQHLTLANMSRLNRYQALNQQVIKMRDGKPIQLHIDGKESIRAKHHNVMIESACTSLQLHLQAPIEKAVDIYNASIMVSAPIVAATANSPYFFGHDLWDETRIPLFEQSVELGDKDYRRVTFGSAYCNESLFECFKENLDHYPVLVPLTNTEEKKYLDCLRFHNGTIWRWNRPLIGIDEDNNPHIRIEHRVIPSGPTVIDSIANAALYFGLVNEISGQITPYMKDLSFENAKSNFYNCAKHGLSAEINWPNKDIIPVRNLLLEELIPLARSGLQHLNIAAEDIDLYLSIIEHRVDTGQNGTKWQREWINKNGKDMNYLTRCYLEQQNSGCPVHEWTL
ncbi:MAG: glutamate--cysteine ligase [Proteobacteria bacterium]|nr:glutamate--cysteine ligase [Pseudomonadota bacterium]